MSSIRSISSIVRSVWHDISFVVVDSIKPKGYIYILSVRKMSAVYKIKMVENEYNKINNDFNK